MATYYLDFENGNDASAGTSWATAWKTITSGATAARTAPGDTIRIAKSGGVTSIGNGTWTNKSATVTLATAQTTSIYKDGAWTLANSATSTTTTARKEGTNAAQITTPASTATSTKYAYLDLGGTFDYSSYDAITLWFVNVTNALADANRYTIKLCSDTTGDTAVDEFLIPAQTNNNRWKPLVLTRVGGGNLGSAIKSIAWYTGSSSPGNSNQVRLDNISACSATGLNLTSLISKNSVEYNGSDTWHGLQSIDGTTVILGNIESVIAGSTSLRGYYTAGTTPETVTTYIRPTIKLPQGASGTSLQTLQESGTAGNLITYSGGWNTSSNTQDGETWLDAQDGTPNLINYNGINYTKFERVNAVRCSIGFTSSGNAVVGSELSCIVINSSNSISLGGNLNTFSVQSNNNSNPISTSSSSPETYDNYFSKLISKNNSSNSTINGSNMYIDELEHSNSAGLLTLSSNIGIWRINKFTMDDSDDGVLMSSNIFIEDATIKNCTTTFADFSTGIKINKLTASGNTNLGNVRNLYVNNLNAATTQILGSNFSGSTLRIGQPTAFYSAINNNANDNRAYWKLGNALSQTTTRHTASGIAWQINITSSSQDSNKPVMYPIAKVACNASSLVTVKAWVKLSHATDIGAKLMIQANEIAGVSADVTATKSADTNWEELTITFTPTVAGVAQIYVQGYWLANLADESIFVDDVTIQQA
jgi:hypothetical protein